MLEHVPNPQAVLRKMFYDLKEGGLLAITLPPADHRIVGGHLTLWNAGLLLYHLVLAGFDCREAQVKTYGYNTSVLVRKRAAAPDEPLPPNFPAERLKQWLPEGLEWDALGGFNGDIRELNW